MVFNPVSYAKQSIEANNYLQQEMLGAAVAATAITFASKHVSQITNLTAFAAAVNGASLCVTAKSAHTIYSKWSAKADEDKEGFGARKSAWKALGLSSIAMTAATLLRGTNILETKFNSLPELNKYAKPLAVASAGTAVLSEAGLYTVKAANSWNNERIKKNEEAAGKVQAAHEALVQKLAKIDEDCVKAMDKDAIAKVAGELGKVIAHNKDDASDELIGRVNAQAAALKIAEWNNIEKA